LAALEQLGFPEMVSECREVVDEVKANAAKRRKGSNRLEQTGFTEEELYEQQQRLIQEAKKQQWEEEQSEYNKINFTTDHLQFQTAPDENDEEDFDAD